jgi:hypothetical protein
MKKFLITLALVASPAHALDKCGPNNELPNDLTPADHLILKMAKEDEAKEERLRIENNKMRDDSVGPELRAYFQERDRELESLQVKEDVPGASTICAGRLGHTYYHQHYIPRYIPRYIPGYIPRYIPRYRF